MFGTKSLYLEDEITLMVGCVDLVVGMNEVMPNSHLPPLLIYNIYIAPMHSGIKKIILNIFLFAARIETI